MGVGITNMTSPVSYIIDGYIKLNGSPQSGVDVKVKNTTQGEGNEQTVQTIASGYYQIILKLYQQ